MSMNVLEALPLVIKFARILQEASDAYVSMDSFSTPLSFVVKVMLQLKIKENEQDRYRYLHLAYSRE